MERTSRSCEGACVHRRSDLECVISLIIIGARRVRVLGGGPTRGKGARDAHRASYVYVLCAPVSMST